VIVVVDTTDRPVPEVQQETVVAVVDKNDHHVPEVQLETVAVVVDIIAPQGLDHAQEVDPDHHHDLALAVVGVEEAAVVAGGGRDLVQGPHHM